MRIRSLDRGLTLIEVDGVRWWLAPGVDPAAAQDRIVRALRAIDGARDHKSGRRKQLYSVALEGDSPDHLVKVNRYPVEPIWRSRLRAGKARRELRIASELARCGIDTPVPVAAGERRRGFALDTCFLLVAIVPGARELRDVWNDPGTPPATRRALTRELGSLARALSDAGLYQPDFAPNNFLVRPGPAPTILPIDFERARWVKAGSSETRIGALAKLERHAGQATRAERLRLLTAYADSRAAARRAWRDIEEGSIALLHRDQSRLLRRATRESRRFRCLERDGWSGWALRDAEFDSSWKGDTAAACLESGPAYSPVGPWLVCREPGRDRPGAEIWPLSQALAIRGLAPRAVAWLERGDERRLIFARSDARAARATDLPATSVLCRRLRGLGTLGNVHPEGIVISRSGNRRARQRALLLDIAAFRPGRNTRRGKI